MTTVTYHPITDVDAYKLLRKMRDRIIRGYLDIDTEFSMDSNQISSPQLCFKQLCELLGCIDHYNSLLRSLARKGCLPVRHQDAYDTAMLSAASRDREFRAVRQKKYRERQATRRLDAQPDPVPILK